MCQHQPRCPEWPAPDHLAARLVADQPRQGRSLRCNAIIAFDDAGELLPHGRTVTLERPGLSARAQAAKEHRGCGLGEPAELIVSELATNAIRHRRAELYRRSVHVPGSVSARRPDGAAPDDNGAPSDDDLLRLHVEGDPDAFGALFRRRRDRLWAVAIGTLRDPEEAADALQDAMVSALRRAATFRGDAAVMTWLHRIVVNACLDRMRRGAACPAAGGLNDDALDTLAGSGRMSDPSGTTDTALDVRAALRRLVPEQQEAIVLVDMLDYPIADAAQVLGVSEGTVKSRVARGRAGLLPRLAHLRPGRDRRDRAATVKEH